MTGALHICISCRARHRTRGPRCVPCQRAWDRKRNAARAQYQGTWQATSQRARRAQPWCSVCGATTDLTLDHEHGQVECRPCNSSHRKDSR